MKYYPINLDLEDKSCIVVGAGEVAKRKVKRLLNCGAKITLISPKISGALKKIAQNNKIKIKNRGVNLRDLAGAYLVVCASCDRKVNSSISSYCKKKAILVNVVDSPRECNFILPSIIARGDLIITISTGGLSPALSKKIRQDLEKRFGTEYGKFLRIMKKLRPQAIKKIKNVKSRKDFFKKVLSPGIFSLLKKNNEKQALKELKGIIENE